MQMLHMSDVAGQKTNALEATNTGINIRNVSSKKILERNELVWLTLKHA